MNKVETAKTTDEVRQTVTIDIGPARHVNARVISEGIFKNGKSYKQGDEVTLERHAAEGLVKTGDVEIIETPKEPTK